jgi:hypothetical protein
MSKGRPMAVTSKPSNRTTRPAILTRTRRPNSDTVPEDPQLPDMATKVNKAADLTYKAMPVLKRAFTTLEGGVYIGKSASWMRKKRLRGADDPGEPGPRCVRTPGGGVL